MPKLLDLAAEEEKSCAPPRMEKWRISSRDGRVRVTVRERALAAEAKFSIRNCNTTIHNGINQLERSNTGATLEQQQQHHPLGRSWPMIPSAVTASK